MSHETAPNKLRSPTNHTSSFSHFQTSFCATIAAIITRYIKIKSYQVLIGPAPRLAYNQPRSSEWCVTILPFPYIILMVSRSIRNRDSNDIGGRRKMRGWFLLISNTRFARIFSPNLLRRHRHPGRAGGIHKSNWKFHSAMFLRCPWTEKRGEGATSESRRNYWLCETCKALTSSYFNGNLIVGSRGGVEWDR